MAMIDNDIVGANYAQRIKENSIPHNQNPFCSFAKRLVELSPSPVHQYILLSSVFPLHLKLTA